VGAEARFYPADIDHFLAWLKARLRPGYTVLVSGFSVVVVCPGGKDDAWKLVVWILHNYPEANRLRYRVEEKS
jgi:hypothetical protein